jgi:dipeptidase E
VGENKRCAVILNAQDLEPDGPRLARVKLGIEEMRSVGFEPEELDLRNYFNKPNELKADLQKYGVLWIRGGNVFVLRRAMALSGFDEVVRDLVLSEKLVYAGFSAGTCAAAPNLHGIELVDDKDDVPAGYSKEIVWKCLGFVPYAIAPHYKSDHTESHLISDAVHYFETQRIPYEALHDGEVIVVDGDKTEILRNA